MTKLDTLLLELEQLDRERTQGGKWRVTHGHYDWQTSSVFAPKGGMWVFSSDNIYRPKQSRPDAEFLAAAVNSNKVLREVVKIQREALGLCASSTQFAPGEYGYQFILLARQALEAAERVCEEKACEEKE